MGFFGDIWVLWGPMGTEIWAYIPIKQPYLPLKGFLYIGTVL